MSSVTFYNEIKLYLKGDWRDFRQEEVTLAAGNFNLNVHGNQSSYERWWNCRSYLYNCFLSMTSLSIDYLQHLHVLFLVHFLIRHHPLWIPSCAEGQENIICWCNSSMVDIELYWNGWNKSFFFYLLVLILLVELIHLAKTPNYLVATQEQWLVFGCNVHKLFFAEAFFPLCYLIIFRDRFCSQLVRVCMYLFLAPELQI